MNIYTAGFPRSGNTWLIRLLADILDASIANTSGEIVHEGDADYCIHKTHSFDKLPGLTLYIQRDPRDVAVSSMHYRCLSSIRDVLAGKDAKEDYLGFDRYEEFVRGWLDRFRKYKAFLIRYEDLHDPLTGLSIISAFLRWEVGVSLSVADLRPAYDRHTFDADLARHGDSHAMWKGQVGSWEHFFDRKTAELFDERLGTLMVHLGYVKDRDWWKRL